MSDYKVNYGAVVLYGILAAIIILAVLYFLNTPIKPAVDGAVAWASARLGSINLGNFDVGKLITENIGAIIGTSAMGVGALITYAKYHGQIKANEKLLELQNELITKNLGLEDTKEGLLKTVGTQAEELQMYTGDKTAEILQTRMSTMKEGYERQITDLQKQIIKLQNDLESRPVINVTETVHK